MENIHYKRLFLLLYFVITSIVLAISNSFEVIQVRGTVTNGNTKNQLIRGSKYQNSDSLIFSNILNRVAVINSKKEAFIVYPKLIGSDLVAIYHPVPFKTDGRPGNITSSINLINHIRENENYIIIGESCNIEIGKKAFPMNADTFFYISYIFENDTIYKRLDHRKDTLIINKTTLLRAHYEANEKYLVDTTLIIPLEKINSFEMGYFDAKNEKRIPIYDPSQPDSNQYRKAIPIKLVFLDTKMLQREVDFLQSAFDILYPSGMFLKRDKIIQAKKNKRIQAHLELIFGGKIEESEISKIL